MTIRKRRRLIVGLAFVLAANCRGQDRDTQELRTRVTELERKVALLERILEQRADVRLEPAGQDQNPAPPVPAEQPSGIATPERRFSFPSELVPEIGKIGSQVGLLLSGSANPFHLSGGSFVAGFIDLPLVDRPTWLHGKLSYEILVGMSQSKTSMQTTSNVAQVANLAVLTALNPSGGLSNVTAAVTGSGPAPFPVTTPVITKLRLLEVIPFSIKYTSSAFERWRLRPYAVLGFGTYVTIHTQYPVASSSGSGVRLNADLPPDLIATVNQLFGGKSPFGAPLVAGQIGQASELEALGLPSGHGSLDFGIQGGFGFEYRLSPTLSLGFDNRYNRIAGAPGLLVTYGSRIGVHF
jgi:hypothetical protein